MVVSQSVRHEKAPPFSVLLLFPSTSWKEEDGVEARYAEQFGV